MKVLFLLGLMRSGTTYFRNVLSSNGSIQALGSELNKFWTGTGRAPSGFVESCPYMDEKDLNESTREAVRSYFYSRYKKRNYPDRVGHRIYRHFKYGNESVFKSSKPYYLLNKSTHLHNKIGYISSIFPEACYIFILRDLPSFSNSLLRHLNNTERKTGRIAYLPENSRDCWGFAEKGCLEQKHYTFEDIITYWLNHNYLALKSLNALPSDRVHYVLYEDLVLDLEGVLDGLDDFLGFKLNRQIDRKIFNNTTTDPLHSWKKNLDPEQVKFMEGFIEHNRAQYDQIISMMENNAALAPSWDKKTHEEP